MDNVFDNSKNSFDFDEQIRKLYQELFVTKDGRWHAAEIIDKYEKHKDLFESREFDPKTEVYAEVVRITATYANALKSNGNVRKAIPYLNMALSLLEKYSKANTNAKAYIVKSAKYELLKWNRGQSYFMMKKFDLALQDFEWLALSYPDNEKYKMWVKTAKLRKRRKAEWVLAVIFLFTTILDIVFKKLPSRLIGSVCFEASIVMGVIACVMIIWNAIEAKKINKYFDSKL